jgi:hypothetical protein
MTFDGKGPKWLRYRSLRRSADTPVIATFFLFNNLYEFPKCDVLGSALRTQSSEQSHRS